MNKIKELYSSPTTKILVVKIGGMLCQSQYGSEGAAGGNITSGGVFNFDDED